MSSDQQRIIVGSRASFFASLANVADLKCKVTFAAADEALLRALEAARRAEGAGNFYNTAIGWVEADLIATEAVALLIEQLPAAPGGARLQ